MDFIWFIKFFKIYFYFISDFTYFEFYLILNFLIVNIVLFWISTPFYVAFEIYFILNFNLF